MEAGKECNCASKKEHSHAKKPCKVCEQSEKGSLTIRSGTVEGDRYN